MKLVKVQIQLIIDDKTCGNSNEDISNYLNNMLYNDPEFFGDFGPENIVSVKELE
jgi:hypothetical protein